MSEAMQQWVKQWDGIWALQMTNEMVKEMENEGPEEEKLENPEKRYAWILRKEYEKDFVSKGLKWALKQQEEAI